ncbi:hypothetical protein N9L29_00895 [Litoricolaceae bacterium]|nr:hypothetical protein [Litorivicinaceae bacterium]
MAHTGAFHRGDLVWIENIRYKQLNLFVCMFLAAYLFVISAESLIKLWMGPDLTVSSGRITAIALSVALSTRNNKFAMFVNGIGKVKIQRYTTVIPVQVNIPLSIILVKQYGLGLSGVVAGMIYNLSLTALALLTKVIRATDHRA